MKRFVYLLAVFMCLAISCNERETNEDFSSALMQGSWRIYYFNYENRDRTSWYQDYKVTFTVQNTVTASGINFVPGKWLVEKEGDRIAVTLDFGKTFPFTILNYKWYVTLYNTQTFTLEYENHYFGGTDHIIFIKW